MINVTLKAKHLWYITSLLKDIVASQYFYLLNNIKTVTTSVKETDDCTVSVKLDDVVVIYQMLSLKPEGQVNDLNLEMNAMLLTQLQTNAGNPDWDYLADKVTAIRTGNLQVTEQAILSGRLFLHP